MHDDPPNRPEASMKPLAMERMPVWVRSADVEHRADLTRYAYSLSQDAALAEDAVQETFVRLMREEPGNLEGHLTAWLFRVCRSRVIDAQRKSRRLTSLDAEGLPPTADPSALDPAAEAEQADTQAFLWEAITHLTPTQQEMMRLKFQAQLSYKEIAEVTGKTVNAVGVHLHTALANLRARLAQHPEW
jgi:RNA polymerase sigma-70 factor, ECF subfamily